MAFDGFLSFGGIEIVNAERTAAYIHNNMPNFPYVRRTSIYDNIHVALEQALYRTPLLDGADWVETKTPPPIGEDGVVGSYPSHGFYGLYPLSISGIGDSTMGAAVTQGILDGGSVNSERDATRSIRVRGLLVGDCMLAAEYGLTWLRNALRHNSCGMHGDQCGYTDLRYFLASPEVCDPRYETALDLTSSYWAGSLDPATSPLIVSDGPAEQPSSYRFVFPVLSFPIPGGEGSAPAEGDGAIIRWEALAYDGPEILESHGPVFVMRNNYVTNPSFTEGTTGWTPTGGTVTRVDLGADSYGHFDQTSPVTYFSNWLPDPSFEHGDPEVNGWRGSSPVIAYIDGSAPFGTHIAYVASDVIPIWIEATMQGPVDTEAHVGIFSFYTDFVGSMVVTVTDDEGETIYSTPVSKGGAGWGRVSASSVPIRRGYTIRVTTNGVVDFHVDAFMLEDMAGVDPIVRTNPVLNPSPQVNANGYLASYGTGGFGSITRTVGAGVDGDYGMVAEWSLTPTSGSANVRYGAPEEINIDLTNLHETTQDFSIYVKPSNTVTLTPTVQFLDYAGAPIYSLVSGTPVSCPAGVWTRLTVSADIPASAGMDYMGYKGTAVVSAVIPDVSAAGWVSGRTIAVDHVMVGPGTYFDGGDPDAGGYSYRFLGSVYASVSAEADATAPTTYFDGDTADDPGSDTNYYFVPDFSGASRRAIGEYTAYSVTTGAAANGVGDSVLSFSARAVESQPEVTVELLDVDDNVRATLVFEPTPAWERYAISTAFGQGVRIKFSSSTGGFDVDEAMLEAGTQVNDYFDGSTTPDEDYTIEWMVTPNASISRMLWTGTTLVARDENFRAALYSVQGEFDIIVEIGHAREIPMASQLDPIDRSYHRVYCTTGVQVIRNHDVSAGAAIEVDFILTAANPHAFSTQSTELEIADTDPVYILDELVNYILNPSAETNATGFTKIDGTSGTAAITNPGPAVTTFGTKVAQVTWSVGTSAAGGGLYYEATLAAMGLAVGDEISLALYRLRTSKSNRFRYSVNFRTDVGSVSTVLGDEFQLASGVSYGQDSGLAEYLPDPAKIEGMVIPATTTRIRINVITVAGTGYQNWANTDNFSVDGLMLNKGPVVRDYIDGSMTDDDAYTYSWEGTTGASPSRRAITVSTPTPIVDPDLPVVPTAPTPPTIPDIAITTQNEWLRYFIEVPADYVALWASTVPTLTLLTSAAEDVRQVRVRFHPNPFERTAEEIDPTDYCGEFLLSYLPPNSSLTVSGVTQEAWASVGGAAPMPANHLLYGTGGTPMNWPDLSCGISYWMTIDIPPTTDIDNLDFDLSVNRRE